MSELKRIVQRDTQAIDDRNVRSYYLERCAAAVEWLEKNEEELCFGTPWPGGIRYLHVGDQMFKGAGRLAAIESAMKGEKP